jgi:hypothetical protein
MSKQKPFYDRFPCVRRVVDSNTRTPVAGLHNIPHSLAAVFIPGCGYEEVQARRLRAAARLYTQYCLRHGHALSAPLVISGTAKEIRHAREYWQHLREQRPWLPATMLDDGAAAHSTHGNAVALQALRDAGNIDAHAPVALVTGAWHMQRLLAHIHDVSGVAAPVIPYRVGHSWSERHAGRAMGYYEFIAARANVRKGKMRLWPYVRAFLKPSGRPLAIGPVTSPAAYHKPR